MHHTVNFVANVTDGRDTLDSFDLDVVIDDSGTVTVDVATDRGERTRVVVRPPSLASLTPVSEPVGIHLWLSGNSAEPEHSYNPWKESQE